MTAKPTKYDKNDPATWNLKESGNGGNSADQPNKPNGAAAENVEDRQAVKNQSSVKPENYPKDDGGRPDYRKNKP